MKKAVLALLPENTKTMKQISCLDEKGTVPDNVTYGETMYSNTNACCYCPTAAELLDHATFYPQLWLI